jgi:hypothetical protein
LEGYRFAKLAAAVRDTRSILAIAWRMDARLTLLYYLTAFVAALAPIASGLALARLIDHVVVASPGHVTVPVIIVVVVATHIAIIAISAAVRFGLHDQYYAYVFRVRLQDTFTYRFCEKLTQLDIPHLEDPGVQTLITQVRSTVAWRIPDLFRMLVCALVAIVGVVSAAIALAPLGGWIVAAVIVGTAPRVYRRVSRLAPVVGGALALALAWSMQSDVTSGALSIGSLALFVTMLPRLATSAADAGASTSAVYEDLLYVRHWNELMALPPEIASSAPACRAPSGGP